MKRIEDLTEEEMTTIIKLAEALSDLVQPYVDAFLYTTEALGKLLAEIETSKPRLTTEGK